MFTNLQLSSVFKKAHFSVDVRCEVPRSIVLYCFYHLGYNCVRCYTPLTGPQGFFACTNLCNTCTLKTFKDAGSRIYVSGSVRFHLSGDKSLVTKGRAFLTHPYWICDDDKYYSRFFGVHGGDPYKLAVEISIEKDFFKEYCTIGMKILCPQVDKAATIREMIEVTYSDTEIVDVPWDTTNECSQFRTEMILSGEEEHTGIVSERSCSDTESIGSTTDVPVTPTRKQICPDWVKNLPHSLRGIFEEQKRRRDRKEPSPLCSGTSHLRDIVVQMHNREGAIIKYLY